MAAVRIFMASIVIQKDAFLNRKIGAEKAFVCNTELEAF
jgi:hypothetical protein